MFLGTQNANNITSLYCKCVDTTQLCPLQLQPTTKGWKANMLVNFQASLHALCTFQHPRVYGMLGHREGPVTQPVWSPVTTLLAQARIHLHLGARGPVWPWGPLPPLSVGSPCSHHSSHLGGTKHSKIPTILHSTWQNPHNSPGWTLLPSTLEVLSLQSPSHPINPC